VSAQLSRGERYCLAVIARRIGDDAAAALIWRQLHHHVVRAADLERAARLHVFALEVERPAGGGRDVDERRHARGRTDPLPRERDVRKGYCGHRPEA
jgi:hypothetical protein